MTENSYRIERTSVADRWDGLHIKTQETVADWFNLNRTHGFIVDRDITEAMVDCGDRIEEDEARQEYRDLCDRMNVKW